MKGIRQAVCDHADALRKYIRILVSVDPGIYTGNQMDTIFSQPDKFIRIETEWISSLHEILQLLQEYLGLVDGWVNHIRGLCQNLHIADVEISQLEQWEKNARGILGHKKFDKDYLEWVIADASQEVDRLGAASQALMDKGPRLIELANKFGGPFFLQVKQITQKWTTSDLRGFHKLLIGILQRIYDVKSQQEQLNLFFNYLQTIGQIISSTPMFAAESTATCFTPKNLESSHQLILQLVEGKKHLDDFVMLRTAAYLLLLRHLEAIILAILPSTIEVHEWIANHNMNPSKTADELLPDTIHFDTLPLALQQARDAIDELDATIAKAEPTLEKAFNFNKLLQSPAMEKFLNADRQRLSIFLEWRPRFEKTFSAIIKATKNNPSNCIEKS